MARYPNNIDVLVYCERRDALKSCSREDYMRPHHQMNPIRYSIFSDTPFENRGFIDFLFESQNQETHSLHD